MSVLNFLKKVEAQVNPFDNGATFSHPAQQQPAQPLAVQPGQQAPAPQGILQMVQQQQAPPSTPLQAIMGHLQQMGLVQESYMNNNPRMNSRPMSSGIAASYLNVRPGAAKKGTIQPTISIIQGGHVQPQMPLYTQSTGQVQGRTGQLQVQPSYLNIRQ